MVYTSPFAGQWYPGEAGALRDLLSRAYSASENRTGTGFYPNGLGYVVPHAGPKYSGTVAAAAYRQLQQQQPKRIVLLGFSHSESHRGVRVPSFEAYRTPLGETPVEKQAIQNLGFRVDGTLSDHSVEIQLPFLRTSLPDATVLPLYVGRMDAAERAEAGKRLATMLDGSTVLLASSDFTHYGHSFGFEPFLVNSATPGRLEQLDGAVMDAASSLDADPFLDELSRSGATVCGYNPSALLLETLRQYNGPEEVFQQRLDYQTSGEITGSYDHSVSYGALGYFPESSFYLDEDDQKRILSAARATIDRYVQTGYRTPVAPEVTSGLSRKGSAFVTVYRKGELQGCIGRLHEPQPLSMTIPELTLSAALEDPRFEPVHRGDTSISLEISVLTPMKRVASTDQFRVREHGALVENGRRRGVLLPKVAQEHGLTKNEFLAALADKAGLPPDIYRQPDTHLSVFRAQVFG